MFTDWRKVFVQYLVDLRQHRSELSASEQSKKPTWYWRRPGREGIVMPVKKFALESIRELLEPLEEKVADRERFNLGIWEVEIETVMEDLVTALCGST